MPEQQIIEQIKTPAAPPAGGGEPAPGPESTSPLPVADKGGAGAPTLIDGGGEDDAAAVGEAGHHNLTPSNA